MTEKKDAVKQIIAKGTERSLGKTIVVNTDGFKTREVIKEISLTKDGVDIEVENPAIISILGNYPSELASPGYGEELRYTIYRGEEGMENARIYEVYIENL